MIRALAFDTADLEIMVANTTSNFQFFNRLY